MRISAVMSIYLGRSFLVSVLTVFGLLLVLILMFDTVELMRRAAKRENVDFLTVVTMAVFHLPQIGQKTAPFAILFGTMFGFWRMSRSRELVVTRSVGISSWQFLLPAVALALILGGLLITVVNPVGSAMLKRYERMENRHLKGQQSLVDISENGLWLRQATEGGQAIIFARQMAQAAGGIRLEQVRIFEFDQQERLLHWTEAGQALLGDGSWYLPVAARYAPGQAFEVVSQLRLPTDLTMNRIQDSFAPPESLSFWDLPAFIRDLDHSGFSSNRHRLHFHSLLAMPLLFCAMVLIAAAFSLRPNTRRGNTLLVIVGGIAAGFLLYFFTDLVYVFGLSNGIPVVLAAWAPALAANLTGLALLFHLEEG